MTLGDGRRGPHRISWPVLLVGALAVALPPTMTAALARPSTDPAFAGLVAGLWAFKVLLLLHAAAWYGLARILPERDTPPAATAPAPHAAGLWALVAVALALRLPGLGQGLWFDEIWALVDYVRQPWGVLLTRFDSTNQHLLYSVAARAVFDVAGESAVALRLPAVLMGVASLWATVVFARRWLPPREAWWCAVLLAVSYHHVWFSQNARGYTGLLLGTLVSSTLLLDLLRGAPATPRRVWSYAGAMALTLLTHVTALVVLAAHGLCWLWQARRLSAGEARWGPFAALVLAGSLALTGYAPLLPQMAGALASSGTGPVGVEWQRPAWFLAEMIRGLGRGVPGGLASVVVAGAVGLAGLAGVWRRDRLATGIMVLPLVIMAALLAATGHNLWPRFFFFGGAFVVMLGVRGGFAVLEWLTPRHAVRVGSVGLAAATIGSLALLPRAWAPKQDYDGALAWVRSHVGPGDAIVGTQMMDLPMNTWLGQRWPIVEDAESLRSIEAAHPRTWVLYTFPIRLSALSPDLWAHLEAEYRPARTLPGTVGDGAIVVLARPALPSTAGSSP